MTSDKHYFPQKVICDQDLIIGQINKCSISEGSEKYWSNLKLVWNKISFTEANSFSVFHLFTLNYFTAKSQHFLQFCHETVCLHSFLVSFLFLFNLNMNFFMRSTHCFFTRILCLHIFVLNIKPITTEVYTLDLCRGLYFLS